MHSHQNSFVYKSTLSWQVLESERTDKNFQIARHSRDIFRPTTKTLLQARVQSDPNTSNMDPYHRSSRSRAFEDYTEHHRSSRPSTSHGIHGSGAFADSFTFGGSSSSRRRPSVGVGPSDRSHNYPPVSFLRGSSSRHLFQEPRPSGSHPSSHSSSRRPSLFDNLEPPTRRPSLSRRSALNEYSDPDPFYVELGRRESRRPTVYDAPSYRSPSEFARSSQHHPPAYHADYTHAHRDPAPAYTTYRPSTGQAPTQFPPTRRPSHHYPGYGPSPDVLDRDYFIRKWDR